jgi:hypothetical protein
MARGGKVPKPEKPPVRHAHRYDKVISHTTNVTHKGIIHIYIRQCSCGDTQKEIV